MASSALRSLAILTVFLLISCVRDLPDLPEVGEGGGITGRAVQLSALTGQLESVEGAVVEVRGVSRRAVTDAEGRFRLERLPLGRFDVVILGPEARVGRKLSSVGLEVDGQSVALGEVRLDEPGSLEGSIALLGESGAYVGAGSLLAVAGAAARGFSDESGRWVVSGLPAGAYDLLASRAGFGAAARRAVPVLSQVRLEVASFQLEVDGAVGLQSVRASIHGDGEPLEDAQATVYAEGLEVLTATSSMGRFEVSLPVGAYRFRFEAPGFVPVELAGVIVLPEAVLGLVPVYLQRLDPQDADRDGMEDAQDPDDDNDGIPDEEDLDPRDPTRGGDQDGDGTPDVLDLDQDGDTLSDLEETELGADGWRTDPRDPDSDGDGVRDDLDVCPTVADDQRDSDEDGRGDACPLGRSVRVDGVDPAVVRPGERVRILGEGFTPDPSRVSVRLGVGGRYVAPETAASNELTLIVPSESSSGPVFVYDAPRAYSGGEVCVDAPPRLVRLQLEGYRAGARVLALGTGLEPPPCAPPARTSLLVSTSSGAVEVPPSGAVESVLTSEGFASALGFVLPDGVLSGEVRLTRQGQQSEALRLELDRGPVRIDRIVPDPVVPGGLVEMYGEGFMGAGGRVTVELPDGRTLELEAASDEALYFSAPDDLDPGVLRVRIGDLGLARYEIRVGRASPELEGAAPAVVQAGQGRIRFYGSGLGSAESVRFAGGAAPVETFIERSENSVLVEVPAGIEPGRVRVALGSEERVSPGRVAVYTERRDPTPASVRGFVRSTAGALWALTSGPTGWAPFDAASGSVGGVESVQGWQDEVPRRALQGPGMPFALVTMGDGAVRILDVSGAAPVLHEGCQEFRLEGHAAIDESGHHAGFVSGASVVVVDLQTGQCSRYALPSGIGSVTGFGMGSALRAFVATTSGLYELTLSSGASASSRLNSSTWQGGLHFRSQSGLLWGGPADEATRAVDVSSGAVAERCVGNFHADAAFVAMGRFVVSQRGILDLEQGSGLAWSEAGWPLAVSTRPGVYDVVFSTVEASGAGITRARLRE